MEEQHSVKAPPVDWEREGFFDGPKPRTDGLDPIAELTALTLDLTYRALARDTVDHELQASE